MLKLLAIPFALLVLAPIAAILIALGMIMAAVLSPMLDSINQPSKFHEYGQAKANHQS